MTMAPLRVAICAEVWSTNLGDGVIAESLAYLVRRGQPDAEVSFLDLNDRPPPGRGGVPPERPHQPAPWRQLRHLPGLVGLNPSRRWWRQLRELGRTGLAWARPWTPPAHPYDLVILGGGQLLMDNDLWFPSRLWLQRHRLAAHSRVFAIHACGVGRQWSPLGRRLVRRLLADGRLVACSVRDPQSRHWAVEHLGCASAPPALVPDPALWAAEAFAIQRQAEATAVGAGIMAPPLPSQGGDPGASAWLTEAFLLAFWHDLIERIAASGRGVRLFTNGAPDDQAFAERLHAQLPPSLRRRTVLLPRPLQAAELVAAIAGCAGFVAQRLHALIIGCSLGVPAVGLVWDDKVRRFGAMAGCPERMLEAATATPELALRRLQEAMAAGRGDPGRDRLRREAAMGVTALMRRLPTGQGSAS